MPGNANIVIVAKTSINHLMNKNKGSLQWRIVLICFLLVFTALAVIAVYIIRSTESYQIGSVQDNIEKTISQSGLMESLSSFDDLEEYSERIQQLLESSWPSGMSADIAVVSRAFTIVASSNTYYVGKSASDVFDTDLLVSVLIDGQTGSSDGNSGDLPLKNFCYAITSKVTGKVIGAVYVRNDISSVNNFLVKNRTTLIQASVVALLLTIILAGVLAKSITGPINKVTSTVKKMSKGEATEDIDVKSDDEIGQLASMFNTLRSELDETIQAMSNEKNKLGTILEYMADGLIAVDLKGNIIHINPAAIKMLGILPDTDFSKVNYDMLLGNISKELSLESMKASVVEGNENIVIALEGKIFAVQYDYFKDENGQEVGLIILIQDITQRQKLQDMQIDFVANVSHELKTPLTNIKGYTETLMDGAIEDKELANKFLGIIDSESDRMNRLVKDLLQLSRMDNQQDNLTIRETNVTALVDLVVTKMAISAEQKNQQLNRLYDNSREVRLDIDRDRFEQVMVNLLSNAIKYTQDGGRVDVDIVEEKSYARIIVQDNGIGIGPEALPRIFERFYRVDKARSRAMGGTGLGLAITKHIIEEHGGSIEAESQEGKGTKITITMPLSNKKGIRNID